MKTLYQREFDGDIPIGDSWIEWQQYLKHIEIVGSSGQGKTTLAEHLLLGLLDRRPAGILHLDPTGDSYRKIVGWFAEGRLVRPAWLVDLDQAVIRYNPLAQAKKDPGAYVDALFSALHLIQATGESSTQHRQMRRYVIATLRALIEADLTLADAFEWLTDENFRAKHLGKIAHHETRQEWAREPSRNDLRSTENWFAVFWQHDALKQVYGGNGFNWEAVYAEQPLVLLNLNAKRLGGSLTFQKALGALFVTGLLSHAKAAEQKKLWYVVIDDATNFTPDHVAPILTLGRHFDLFLILIHHYDFQGELQKAVAGGCRTKFYFGEIPREHRGRIPGRSASGRSARADEPTHLDAYQALQIFDGQTVQVLKVEPTPDFMGDSAAFAQTIFGHPWYGEERAKKERVKPGAAAPKPPRPPIAQDRRGK